jgi:UDP-2,4-diacetamido-2,4,6-trideoxy-beta-L-altropyranose hydrolase
LRADGNGRIGLGHVHRLLALSEILREHFDCIFLIRDPLPGLRQLIDDAGSKLISLPGDEREPDVNWAAVLNGKDIVVLDGYRFDTHYQKQIKDKGASLVCIDDINIYQFVADVVINPAGGVSMEAYATLPSTRKFSGPRYAPVKSAFSGQQRTASNNDSAQIMICMGGADPQNFTQQAFTKLASSSFSRFYLIVGEAYANRSSLESIIANSGKNVELLSNCSSTQIARIMKECDIAVCSASGISYEYLTVGGELYIMQTADNQKLMYQFLISEGLAFDFAGFRQGLDQVDRAIIAQSRVFDGGAPDRIRKIFWELEFNMNATVRRATISDCYLLFEWTNDPDVRRQSFNSEPVTLDEHTSWFNRKLADPSTVIYIFEVKGVPVAVVRFDTGRDTVINYSLDRRHRGKGWAALILKKAMTHLFAEEAGVPGVIGFVKHHNLGSCKVFESLGFVRSEAQEFSGSYKFEYKRNG